MKRIRLSRWSGQLLSPRSRSQCPYLLSTQQPHNHRPQSTAAALSTSADDINAPPDTTTPFEHFPSPPVSASTQSAKLAALHARLQLPPRLPLQTLARTLVDKTADPNPSFNNTALAVLGADILGYYTSEHIICHYPRLPMAVLFAAQWAYVGSRALATIREEWGVETAAAPGGEVDPGLLQLRPLAPGTDPLAPPPGFRNPLGTGRPNEEHNWRRGSSSKVVYDDEFGDVRRDMPLAPRLAGESGGSVPERAATTVEEASAGFVRAVAGAVYLHSGRDHALRFFNAHVLSRSLDISALFDFRHPTRELSRLCLREGFENPVARLLSETGRASRHPVFVVGVFSGRDKLGEGSGASLDEARFKAAGAALKSWYLYSPLEVTKPSVTERAEGGMAKWIPNLVDAGEVVS